MSGVPSPRVKWLKNGLPLAFSRRVRRLDGGRRVEMRRAAVSDTARYTCIAVNDAGELRRHYDLQVLGSVSCTQYTSHVGVGFNIVWSVLYEHWEYNHSRLF